MEEALSALPLVSTCYMDNRKALQQNLRSTSKVVRPHAHLEVLEHAIEDGAVGLADGSQVEAPHVGEVLLLIVRRHLRQEVEVVCETHRCVFQVVYSERQGA